MSPVAAPEEVEDRLALAAIVETLGEAVLSTALDGTIHGWNAGAEQFFGYSASEIVGRHVSALAAPERRAEIEGLLARLRRGDTVHQFETVRRRKDGAEVPVSLNISPVRSPVSGEVVGAAVVVYDVGEQRRREKAQSFLAEASRLLAVDLDVRENLTRVARLTLSSLAEWCLIEIADEDGSFAQLAVAHRDPAKVELAREMRRRYPPDAGRPDVASRVHATGRAELIPAVPDALLANIARSPEHLRMLHELGLGSLIVVPLRARERVLGTILLANGESGRPLGPPELELAEDLGRRAALAIDNARLLASEREARRRAERALRRIAGLQAVTAALSGAVTPSAVAEVFVRHGGAALGASGGFVRLLARDGRGLELEATIGYTGQFERSYRSLPLSSPLPGAEVFRTGGELYFESAAAVASSAEFAREHAAMGHEAIAFVPLRGLRGRIGLMALSFAEARTFDDDDRELLRALADQCTQAIERARLYEGEREARAAAEVAIERTKRLQILAAELAEALTPAQVADVVVTQGIASVGADAGALQLLVDGGETLELVCGKGRARKLVEQRWQRFSTELNLPAVDALRTREPVFLESSRDVHERYPHDPAAPLALQARAGAHIPLIVSGRPLGVLFLGYARPRRFSASQRSLMLAFGRQCAQALKRAQLYETELEARTELGRLVERLHEGVISVDRRGRVAFASSNARRMIGPASLAQGSPLPEAWLGFPLRSFAAGLFEPGEHVLEARVVGREGELVFDVTGIPAARADTALVVVGDVSDRERRSRAEREFVANAAHELRTPLAAIKSSIDRLQAGARDVPEKRDRFLGHIERESARLNRLVSSLLMLARIQTGEEEPWREAIPLRRLLEELMSGLEPGTGVELLLDCPPELLAWTNGELLEHALLNLAGNAVRHTRRGRIRVGASFDCAGALTIEIADTGSGMTADQLERLFDRFYVGPGETGRSGVGLGLPITKEVVEALGGRVEIDSVLGEGTTARIVLPDADVPVAP